MGNSDTHNMIFSIQGIHKFLYVPTSTSLDTRDFSIRNVDFPGVTVCPNSKIMKSRFSVVRIMFIIMIMKSRFRAAISSTKLPWANITAKLDAGAASDFQYSVLDYLANMVIFSSNSAGVISN